MSAASSPMLARGSLGLLASPGTVCSSVNPHAETAGAIVHISSSKRRASTGGLTPGQPDGGQAAPLRALEPGAGRHFRCVLIFCFPGRKNRQRRKLPSLKALDVCVTGGEGRISPIRAYPHRQLIGSPPCPGA